MRKVKILVLLLAAGAVFACQGCGDITGPSFAHVASPRAIVNTPSSPATGVITVRFQVIDRERELADVTLEYSTDGGQTFYPAALTDTAEATSLTSDWYPGITHALHWRSVDDMVGRSGAVDVCLKVTPSDATNPSGTAGVSGIFTVDNLAFNEHPGASVDTPLGVQYGNVQVTCDLTDAEGDPCTIQVEYSDDNGVNWYPATEGPAGDGTTGLSSSPGGEPHVFLWNCRADGVAPSGLENDIKVRVTPTDFNEGTAGTTDAFTVNNTIANIPPTIAIISGPADGTTVLTEQVTFSWSGSDSDGLVVGYYYSFDLDPFNWTTETSVTSNVLSTGEHTFRVFAMDDEDGNSITVSRTFSIFIPGIISADFSATPRSGGAPLEVYFTDQSTSTSGITSWNWNFGDGGTSVTRNPSHTYTNPGRYTVTLTVRGLDGTDEEIKADYIVIQTSIEDFETGNLTKYPWVTGGDAAWYVTNSEKYAGTYSARAGYILHDEYSYLEVTLTVDAGSVSFYRKVSSESSCDELIFLIDGVEKQVWSGSLSWTRVSFSVTAGTHTFTWIYIKDYSVNTGSDTAWIDNISFPVSGGGGETIYVDGLSGNDINSGLSWGNAVRTIQTGLNKATSGSMVIVANGTYTGANNKNLDFDGKTIHLRSESGLAGCIIDCQGSGRGFFFHNGETSASIVEGFTIRNGYAGAASGGGIMCGNSSPTITNCRLTGNTTDQYGGAIACDNSGPAITGCEIDNNSASDGGGIIATNGSTPQITNCLIRYNVVIDRGGGILLANNSHSNIVNCTIRDNTATNLGGGIYCTINCDPVITGCTIERNTAILVAGGGILALTSCNLSMRDCIIRNNVAQADSGGIECYDNCNLTMTNCLVSQNEATDGVGGGLLFYNSTGTITNCTIAFNDAGNRGGGIYCSSSSTPTLNNTILWGNIASGSGSQIYTFDAGSMVMLNYCDYDNDAGDIAGNGTVLPGNCLNLDPQFVNAASGDFHLLISSPCVDAGNNTFVPAGVTTDLDGNARFIGAAADMGAYER